MKRAIAVLNKISVFIITIFIFSPSYSSIYLAINESLQDTLPENKKTEQPVYVTSRLVTPRPVIDGKLDDECWNYGTWAGDYTQFVPNEGAEPSYPTEMNIQYDDRNIYIAFRCYDGEPNKITRMAGLRDEQVGDIIGLSFDSYRDYRTGFDFS